MVLGGTFLNQSGMLPLQQTVTCMQPEVLHLSCEGLILTSRLSRVFLQIPSPYGAAQHAWPQQQQQQQGMPGPGQPPMQYPYPPFMPMLLPYGMPPPAEGMPPGPFQMHMAGAHHPGAPQAPPNPGTQRHPPTPPPPLSLYQIVLSQRRCKMMQM